MSKPGATVTDDELVRQAGNASASVGHGYVRPQAELIKRLKESIDRLNDTSTDLQVKMLDLTRGLVVLTVAMIIVGLVQIGLVVVTLIK